MTSVKIWCSLFWMLFSIVMGRQASQLPMGEMREPGAGFFPLLIAVVIGLLAVLALITALTAYALTLQKVGFLINTFLLMLLLVKMIEPQSWTKSLIAALITAVVSELFFNVLLNAQIPRGILGF